MNKFDLVYIVAVLIISSGLFTLGCLLVDHVGTLFEVELALFKLINVPYHIVNVLSNKHLRIRHSVIWHLVLCPEHVSFVDNVGFGPTLACP